MSANAGELLGRQLRNEAARLRSMPRYRHLAPEMHTRAHQVEQAQRELDMSKRERRRA